MTKQQLVDDLNEVGVSLTQFREAWKTGYIAREGGITFSEFIEASDDSYNAVYSGFRFMNSSDGIKWFGVTSGLLKIINKRKEMV
jgi:hypothetical protein